MLITDLLYLTIKLTLCFAEHTIQNREKRKKKNECFLFKKKQEQNQKSPHHLCSIYFSILMNRYNLCLLGPVILFIYLCTFLGSYTAHAKRAHWVYYKINLNYLKKIECDKMMFYRKVFCCVSGETYRNCSNSLHIQPVGLVWPSPAQLWGILAGWRPLGVWAPCRVRHTAPLPVLA